jgi:hypothetical protein
MPLTPCNVPPPLPLPLHFHGPCCAFHVPVRAHLPLLCMSAVCECCLLHWILHELPDRLRLLCEHVLSRLRACNTSQCVRVRPWLEKYVRSLCSPRASAKGVAHLSLMTRLWFRRAHVVVLRLSFPPPPAGVLYSPELRMLCPASIRRRRDVCACLDETARDAQGGGRSECEHHQRPGGHGCIPIRNGRICSSPLRSLNSDESQVILCSTLPQEKCCFQVSWTVATVAGDRSLRKHAKLNGKAV